MEQKKFSKMKIAGYACLLFAVLLTALVVFGAIPDGRIDVTVTLINTWSLTGIGLLFGNAGKRLGGYAVEKKTEVFEK